MSVAADLPASLKPIAPYLQKAKELQTINPVVAHFCKLYAVEMGCKVGVGMVARGLCSIFAQT